MWKYNRARPSPRTCIQGLCWFAPAAISLCFLARSQSFLCAASLPLQLQITTKLHFIQIHANIIVPKHAQNIKSNSSMNFSSILSYTYFVISWFWYLPSYFFITESKYNWMVARITPKTLANANKYFWILTQSYLALSFGLQFLETCEGIGLLLLCFWGHGWLRTGWDLRQ